MTIPKVMGAAKYPIFIEILSCTAKNNFYIIVHALKLEFHQHTEKNLYMVLYSVVN